VLFTVCFLLLGALAKFKEGEYLLRRLSFRLHRNSLPPLDGFSWSLSIFGKSVEEIKRVL
jgi:hypothetical protein